MSLICPISSPSSPTLQIEGLSSPQTSPGGPFMSPPLRSIATSSTNYSFLFLSPTKYPLEGSDYKVGSVPEPVVLDLNMDLSDHQLGNYMKFGPHGPMPMKPTDTPGSPTPINKVLLNIETNEYTTTMEDGKPVMVMMQGKIKNGIRVKVGQVIKDFFNLCDHDHNYCKKPKRLASTSARIDKKKTDKTIGSRSGAGASIAKYYTPEFILCGGLMKNGPNPEKPYACPVPGCLKSYKDRNGIKYHSKYSHSPPKRFDCNLCEKSYLTLNGLQQHNRSAHDLKKRMQKKKPKLITKQENCSTSQPKISFPETKVKSQARELQERKNEIPNFELKIIEEADSSKYNNYDEDDQLAIDFDFDCES